MRIIDISPAVSPRLGVWPGDVAFALEETWRMADGASVNLGAIRTTLHLGAHADAPKHYDRSGADIGARSLTPYLGPCQVIEVAATRGARIHPHDLMASIAAPRVLFKTGTFPDPDRFTTDFAALSAALIDHLYDNRSLLVGIDTPSIDLFEDKILESHNAVRRHGLSVLEGLVLAHVPPGRYTLVALPLRLEGADASPVRAVLLEEM